MYEIYGISLDFITLATTLNAYEFYFSDVPCVLKGVSCVHLTC